MSTLVSYVILAFVVVLGCTCTNSTTSTTTVDSSTLQIQTYAQGLEAPWALAFAPDGRLFVTERPGRIRVIENGILRETPLRTLSNVEAQGEAGLMGMALHPNFANNHWIYVCYATNAGGSITRVERFRETGDALVDDIVILDHIPAGSVHAGCRIKFGPDQKLYVTTGETGIKELAQDLGTLAGKTLRLNDDGSVPSDNPFRNQSGAKGEIFSYGHRNPQGLDWQPSSGLMFETEHGPSGFDAPGGGDEVNIVEAGKNYGWPIIHHTQTQAGLESPILEYTPAVAPSGATFYRSNIVPSWQGSFFFACLRGERIIRLVFNGRTVVSQENWLQGEYGRLRDVAEGPDGALYVATSNRDGRGSPSGGDDRILRIAFKP